MHRSRRHTLLLVTSAVVLMLVGITTDLVASNLGKGPSYPTSPRSQLSSSQLARALVGRQFTRDVIPPDLATAPPLSDVFIADQVPGLVGESTTTTTDQGSTVTFYVFSDPIWAQAFMANPPIAYGCGVCTSMKGASAVDGVGDRATSYVLYRKSAAGESWIATTTYAARGAVVINAWFMPVNVGTPAPSSTDLYVPTADAKAAVALLQRISAG